MNVYRGRFRTGALVLSAVLVVGGATRAAALEPYGIWVRQQSGTYFDFYNCAGKLCAKIIAVSKGDDKKAIGTVVLRNAVRKDNEWRGDLYNLEDGKIYKGSITVDKPGELNLEGCLIQFLCKSETWKRAPDQSAASTPNGQPAMPAPAAKPAPGQ